MSQRPELESMTPEEKRALLAKLLDGSVETTPSTLLLEQRRLWLLHQLDNAKPWQVSAAVRLSGPIDPAAMQQALVAVVQRHEVLRATFREVNGQAIATTAAAVTLRLPVHDIDPGDLDGELARVAAAETATRFDLGRGPLVRASLLRAAPDDHVFLLTAHQMVADRRSVRLIVDEVLSRYTALSGGAEAPPTGTPADFRSLVDAQRAWSESDDAGEAVDYWRARLAALSPLELPTDRPRPPLKTIHGDAVTVPVPASLAADLTAGREDPGRRCSPRTPPCSRVVRSSRTWRSASRRRDRGPPPATPPPTAPHWTARGTARSGRWRTSCRCASSCGPATASAR